jgi:hypothetical protein
MSLQLRFTHTPLCQLRSALCFIVLVMVFCCNSCGDMSRADGEQKRAEWKVGYWYWQGWHGADSDVIRGKQPRIDVVYVRIGEYHTPLPGYRDKSIRVYWPDNPPQAETYFAVLRCEGSTCTSPGLIPAVTKSYQSLKKRTSQRGQRLIGLQIDYDCPTIDLDRYGAFLRELKNSLPKEDVLSVTALLDWFGPGTSVSKVVEAVDEFVPQFYDVDYRNIYAPDGGIAEPINPRRWAPVFNSFQKPYRVGISSFGRVLHLERTGGPFPEEELKSTVVYGQSPLEIVKWQHGAFVCTGMSRAGEAIASFETRSFNGSLMSTVETIKMIIPTEQSVSLAFRAAKAMGGFCSGVIFFRHPVGSEALALSPAEVSRIIAGKGSMSDATTVEADDGFCATVSCSDVFIRMKDRFPAKDVVLTVTASGNLEYFVPYRLVEGKMLGSRRMEVHIPAFAGAPRIPIGRAVSRDPVTFTVEERP